MFPRETSPLPQHSRSLQAWVGYIQPHYFFALLDFKVEVEGEEPSTANSFVPSRLFIYGSMIKGFKYSDWQYQSLIFQSKTQNDRHLMASYSITIRYFQFSECLPKADAKISSATAPLVISFCDNRIVNYC